MTVVLTLEPRPHRRSSRWVVVVLDASGLVRFSSRRISIHFADRDAAERFGEVVERALEASVLPSFPGLPRARTIERLVWCGEDLDDDASAELSGLSLRTEWLSGPARKGGLFHAAVGRAGEVLAHDAEDGVVLRSAAAARWWAELMARVASVVGG